MKKIVLVAFVLVLLSTTLSLCVAGLLRLQIAYASPYTDIDVETANNMITNGSYPDLVILDVRRQDEYDTGHIYGAVWIPHTELETRISELAGHENHEIIVYCRTGVRSVNASETLDSYNFTKVYNMLGGITAWQSAGYEVSIAAVHNVNTTLNYDTIQAAIDAHQTLDGHTILVDAGTYYENVVVNKTVSLIGENKYNTIIDGNGTGTVIEVATSNVNIAGFTIQNSGVYKYAIYVSASGNNISHNIITNNYDGIVLEGAHSNTVSGNTVSSNDEHGIRLGISGNNTLSGNTISNNNGGITLSFSGNNTLFNNNMTDNTSYNFWVTGNNDSHFDNSVDVSNMVDGKPVYYLKGMTNTVYDAQTNAGTIYFIKCNNITIQDLTPTKDKHGVCLWNTVNSKIENVTVSNNYAGIYLQRSSNNTVSGNIASNSNLGICLDRSNNNTFLGNNASNNGCGIRLYGFSSNNTVIGNTVSNNGDGIYLDSSSNNTVIGNIASNSWAGIRLEASSNNTITGNIASNNVHGIYLGSSSNNTLFHNNLVGNTVQASVTTGYINTWDDGYPSGGNYWSDYEEKYPNATEIDGSGIWDTPYIIDENNQDNYPIVPEFPTWTSMLLILIMLTVAIVIYKRRPDKTPIH